MRMFYLVFICVCVSLQLNFLCAEAKRPRCFECANYPSPTLCSTVTTCTEDDVCYVEEYVTSSGHVQFTSGCMNKNRCAGAPGVGRRGVETRGGDFLVCSTCCQGDLCNIEGCGMHAIPRDQRGPFCFQCDFMTAPDECDTVSVCPSNQLCGLSIPSQFHLSSTALFTAGCHTNQTCAQLAKTPGNVPCFPSCCDTDFCNTACGTPPSTTATPPSTMATSHSTAATPPSTTATPPSTTATPPSTTATPPSTKTTSSITPTTTPNTATPLTTAPTTSSTITPATSPTHTPTNTPTNTPTMKASSTAASTTSTTTTTTTTTTTPAMPTTSKQLCDRDGYHTLPGGDGICINVVEWEAEWSIARIYCRGQGGDLVVLNTEAKIRAVTEYIKHHHELHRDKYWIGAYDMYNNDVMHWIDGQPVEPHIHDWHSDVHPGPDPHHPGPDHHHPHRREPGHDPGPDQGHLEDCALLDRHPEYHWRDMKCDDPHTGFICERK